MKYSETVFINKVTLLYEMFENEIDILKITKDTDLIKRLLRYCLNEIGIFLNYLKDNKIHLNDEEINIILKMQDIINHSFGINVYQFIANNTFEQLKNLLEKICQFDFSKKVENTNTEETNTIVRFTDPYSYDEFYLKVNDEHIKLLKWLQDEILIFDKAEIEIDYDYRFNIKEL